MSIITINEDKLKDFELDTKSSKVRAVLVKDNKLLIAKYGGVYLLPGGSIDEGETKETAILRELREETGIVYDINDLKNILTLNYYQRNHIKRNGKTENRLMITDFYLSDYRGIDESKVQRTEKEIRDGFCLELFGFDEVDSLINEPSDNPRKADFDRELSEAIKVYKKISR